ncbi:hypothetical protein QCA50_005542 [Cerrena zonata]|uniref:Chromosome transmission fidelity protein 8 n=1 Tax=Cerrena zonata TaxID=2478898 RepID=A0AAW0GLD9_9APHY
MIIPINLHPERSSSTSSTCTFPPALAQFGSDELILVELQGSLEVEGDNIGATVGKLSVDPSTKKPTLLIGHHLLEGKLVNLPKPLAVLHNSPLQNTANDESNSMSVDGESKGSSKSWDVVAVVKKKMVFAKRPIPIMLGKNSGMTSLGVEKKTT